MSHLKILHLSQIINQAPAEGLTETLCVFCGNKIDSSDYKYLEQFLSINLKNLLTGAANELIWSFCSFHDPLTIPSPLPEGLQKLLDDERALFLSRDEPRKAQEKKERKTNEIIGALIGSFASPLGASIGAGIGAGIAIAENATDDFDRFFSKKSDLLLRINTVIFNCFVNKGRLGELPDRACKRYFSVIEDCKGHLERRIAMFKELGDDSILGEQLKETELALTGLNGLRDHVYAAKQQNDRYYLEIQKARIAHEKGLISEEQLNRLEEKIKEQLYKAG